ncbi:MAG: PASTA domain-containing protein, partial [Ilumatobacteraceae bacterium]
PEAHERSSAAQFGRSLVQAAEKLPRPEPLPLLSTGLFETPPERLRDPDDPTGGLDRPAAPDLLITTSDEPSPDAVSPEPVSPDAVPPDAVSPDAVSPDAVSPDAGSSDEVIFDLGSASGGAPAPSPAPPDPAPAAEPPAPPDPAASPDPPDPAPAATTPVDIVVLDVDDPVPSGAVTTVPPGATVPPGPTVPPGGPARPPAEPFDEPSGRRHLVWVITVPLLVLAALVGLLILAVQLFSTPSYDVPDLVGAEQSAALLQIDDFDWDLQIDLERSDEEPRAGHVIRTVPAAGERLAEGEPFLLVVSEGPVLRELPELRDLSFVEAVTTLESLALEPVTEQRHDEDVPADRVIEWSVADDPNLVAGAEVEPGTEILVVGSLGPEPRVVPDFSGAERADVVAELAELGLVLIGPEEDFDDEVPEGLVISQDPEPGAEVERGSEVTVTISLGPDVVPVPEVIGLTFEEAETALEEAGLVANLVFGASDGVVEEATVDGEPVEVGEMLPRGTQIDLTAL